MRNFFRRKDLIKNHKKLATFLAVIVALVTAYLLILPAITLDNETALQDPGIEVEQSSQSPPSLPAPQDNQLGSATESSSVDTSNSGATQATTLTAQNQDYTIKADVDEKTQLPKDTTLTVKEIKNDDAAYQANYEKV
ncbi:hypothetical protein [Streptococcus infantarius]|uniref:hypothetical protein n=1 Tax=Streptococcus infantarius TaxID=102684 RepID=UPI002935A32E|nr:hypothetical protein [Streptococcus infantarius]MDV2595568.1 hypothetical protein [Streptococcus infantarius]